VLPPGKLTCIKLAIVHAQKLHIFWRSLIILLPVCCLLINCIGKQFLLYFYAVIAITGHLTCFRHRIFRVPARQCPAHRAKETVALLTTEHLILFHLRLHLRTPWTSILLTTATRTCLPHQGWQCGRLKTAHRNWMGNSWS